MKLREIEKIQSDLKSGLASNEDSRAAAEEAVHFHHKVSELQEMLLLIQKKCEMELNELENGQPVTQMHFALVMDYILDIIKDSRHIRAA